MAIITEPSGNSLSFWGTNERDYIYGDATDAVFYGFIGNDFVLGGAGRDRIQGGEGDDILVGDGTTVKSYRDEFLFGKMTGDDVILDFDVRHDTIVIAKGLSDMREPKQVFDHLEQQGKHVMLDLGDGNAVKLLHVDIDDLSKANFEIV